MKSNFPITATQLTLAQNAMNAQGGLVQTVRFPRWFIPEKPKRVKIQRIDSIGRRIGKASYLTTSGKLKRGVIVKKGQRFRVSWTY